MNRRWVLTMVLVFSLGASLALAASPIEGNRGLDAGIGPTQTTEFCEPEFDPSGIEVLVPDTVTQAPALISVVPVHRFEGKSEMDITILLGDENVFEVNILMVRFTDPLQWKWDLKEIPSGKQAPNGIYRVVVRVIDLDRGYSSCNEGTFRLDVTSPQRSRARGSRGGLPSTP